MQLLLKSLIAQESGDSELGAASTISTDEDLTSSQIELTGEKLSGLVLGICDKRLWCYLQ